ncbi:MAG: hypothetical protein HQL55_18875, partial [Magnetococcales bacterium]|nr:hypothetical protein [Magnetococcales bacterium]
MTHPFCKDKSMTWTKLPKDFRPLMEKLPIGILVHLGGTIHYVNQTLVNMLHARSDVLIGLPATDLFSPESKQFLYQSTA